MTISSSTNRNTYTGNGAVDTYSYTFKIFAETDLLVTVKNTSDVETTLALTTDYTVTGVGETSGGTVVLVNSGQAWLDGDGDLLTNYIISIRRVRPLTQLTDIRNQGDFFPEVHEDEFDKQIMIDQQQQDEIDRTIKLPETLTSSDFDTELPTTIGTANAALVVNSTGDGWAVGPTTDQISSAQSSATAAAASASAALTSENNAAASAAQAASSLASAFFSDAIFYDNSDSPVTLTSSDNGKLHVFDSSGGAISVTLPQISTLTLPYNLAFLCSADGNDITVNRSGTDTIQGSTSKVLNVANTGFQLIADDDTTPDTYSVLEFGSVGDGTVTRVKLAQGAVARRAVTSKTANYTATTNDDLIVCDTSSGGFTITLPAVSGIDGKLLQIKKTTSDFNVVTIDGNSSETIDGATTIGLITQYESVTLVAGASEWHVVDRDFQNKRTAYSPGSDFNGNTVVTNRAAWTRVGRHHLMVEMNITNTTMAAAEYRIPLPSGLTCDSSYVEKHIVGKGGVNTTTTGGTMSIQALAGRSYLTVGRYADGVSIHELQDGNGNVLFTNGGTFSFTALVAIDEFDI